ncbi:hypothetical protein ACT4UT_08630, partial [Bacillus sp. B-TM1]
MHIFKQISTINPTKCIAIILKKSIFHIQLHPFYTIKKEPINHINQFGTTLFNRLIPSLANVNRNNSITKSKFILQYKAQNRSKL